MKKNIKKLNEFRKWFDEYIQTNFGKKCRSFVWGCGVCRAHFVKELFGDFINDLIEDENWFKKTKEKSKD